MRLYPQLHKLFLAALLFSIALAACSGNTPAELSATVPLASPQVQITSQVSPTAPAGISGPKSITLLYTRTIDNLNPLYSSLQVNDQWFSAITLQIWNAWAWDFDEQNNSIPVLVKEIPSLQNGGISSDGRVITMQLRDDIVWSDGQPITSADFRFTFQMAVNPNNSVATSIPYNLITSLDTPDERTVVITFSQPYIPWLGNLWHGLLPSHILQPVFDTAGTLDNAEWNTAPTVGCGPYVFSERLEGESIRFVANDRYWAGRPKIDEVTIRFMADNAEQTAALSSGQGDLGLRIAYPDVPSLQTVGLIIQKVFSGYNEGLFFYMHPFEGHPALQDARVRQAIAQSIDRPTLIREVLLDQTAPAATYWDNTPYIDPGVQPWAFDPERARGLLDEAGWVDANGDGVREKGDVNLEFTYGTTTSPVRLDAQTKMVAQLAQVGIRLEPSSYDTETFFQDYAEGGPAATGQLDIFQYAPTTNPGDPHTTDFLCGEIPSEEVPTGTNWSYYCDQELDALFQLELTQIDFNQRQQTFHQISKMIFDRLYFVGLWQEPDLWAMRSRLANVRLSGPTPFFNIMEWDLTE